MSEKLGDSKDIQSGAEVQSRCWEEENEEMDINSFYCRSSQLLSYPDTI